MAGGSNNSAATKAALNKLFDQYREKASDEPDLVGVDGTMNYLQQLDVDLEGMESLVVLEIIHAPTMGEIAREGFVNGWLDYFTPQLYWPIEQTAQSYPVLLNWWASQNEKGRHLWPGNYTSRVGEESARAWPPEEIVYQVKATRGQAGATGNVHFSMKALMKRDARNGTSRERWARITISSGYSLSPEHIYRERRAYGRQEGHHLGGY